MSSLLRRLFALGATCGLLHPLNVYSQTVSADSGAYAIVRLDSAQILRLPLSRSSELPAYLPGAIIGVDYSSALRATIGRADVRVDGVPVGMFTFNRPLLYLAADAVSSLEATPTGSGVEYGEAFALSYSSRAGGTKWRSFARGAADIGIATSPGGVRAAVGASGPMGQALRIAANVSAQSAQRTEFNNFNDVRVYGVSGTDTTISFVDSNNQTQTVAVPRFEELSGSRILDSNWNELLGSARVDLVSGSNTDVFLATHYTRLQERAPFGGSCTSVSTACNVYNSSGQVAMRQTGWLGLIGGERKLGRSTLSLRVARTTDEIRFGVITESDALEQNDRTGLDLSGFDFLVEPSDFPVDDALIQRIINNDQTNVVPLPLRFDLNGRNAYRANPYGTTDFRTSGIGTNYRYVSEKKLFASLIWRGQLGVTALTAGAEMSSLDARYADVSYTNPVFLEVWKENPSIQSAFLSDAIVLGNVTIDAGVRFDSYNPNTEYSVVPGFIGPEVMVKAERASAFSPRVGIAAAAGPALLRVNYVAAAQVPYLTDQFNGINTDFFRFRNTNTQTQFARPLDLIEVRALNASADFATSSRLRLRVNAVHQETNNGVAIVVLAWEDPTNPGSTTFLRTPHNRMTQKTTAVDATAEYRFDGNHSVRVTALRESRDRSVPGTISLDNSLPSITAVLGVAQIAGPRIAGLQNFDMTVTLRARSGLDMLEFADGEFTNSRSSWATRLDARLARAVRVGRAHASVWVDALRLVGSSPLFKASARPNSPYVEAQMATVGGGSLRDVDLTSLDASGLRNDVDLYLVRNAEARFGNGDRNFTMAEQRTAFSASEQLHALAARPFSPGRRIVVGVEVGF